MTAELEPLTEEEVIALDDAMNSPLECEGELLSVVEKRAGEELDSTEALRLITAMRLLADCEPATIRAFVTELDKADRTPEATLMRKDVMTMTDTLTPAEVVGNVIGLLRKSPGAVDVIMKALESDPALAEAYRDGVSSGDAGRAMIAEEQAKAEVRKAARPGKHAYLVAVDEAIAKSASGADYAKVTAEVALADPELYSSYVDSIVGRR